MPQVAFLLIYIVLFSMADMSGSLDLSGKRLGFVGCGKISSCVVRGYASASGTSRPLQIIVSPRSKEKAEALALEYPDVVTVAEDNESVVRDSDVVFIGLLPGTAREVLPTLPFGGTESEKLVISMMAAIQIGELRSLVGISDSQIVRTVPLPSSARREGPILAHPSVPAVNDILEIVGSPVCCADEKEMTPLVCLTGHISSFFDLMRTTQDFMVDQGVDSNASRKFISSFYTSLARATELSEESLADMAEEAATPGGINEQSIGVLRETEHFKAQYDSLNTILLRLEGKVPYVPKEKK